ncbi:hypothetical protein BaRGS_00018689, partial [Batillaria attramentaria]
DCVLRSVVSRPADRQHEHHTRSSVITSKERNSLEYVILTSSHFGCRTERALLKAFTQESVGACRSRWAALVISGGDVWTRGGQPVSQQVSPLHLSTRRCCALLVTRDSRGSEVTSCSAAVRTWDRLKQTEGHVPDILRASLSLGPDIQGKQLTDSGSVFAGSVTWLEFENRYSVSTVAR